MWTVGTCIVYTGIRQLLLIYHFIGPFFFFSNFQLQICLSPLIALYYLLLELGGFVQGSVTTCSVKYATTICQTLPHQSYSDVRWRWVNLPYFFWLLHSAVKAAPVADWLRRLIFSALNRLSSHGCTFSWLYVVRPVKIISLILSHVNR